MSPLFFSHRQVRVDPEHSALQVMKLVGGLALLIFGLSAPIAAVATNEVITANAIAIFFMGSPR
jgi:hypothetical protein